VCEEGAISPDVDADSTCEGYGEIFAGVREGKCGTGALRADCVDEMTCGEVPDTNDGVCRSSYYPAAVVGEAEVVDGGW